MKEYTRTVHDCKGREVLFYSRYNFDVDHFYFIMIFAIADKMFIANYSQYNGDAIPPPPRRITSSFIKAGA